MADRRLVGLIESSEATRYDGFPALILAKKQGVGALRLAFLVGVPVQ